jgi:hypothetical protein
MAIIAVRSRSKVYVAGHDRKKIRKCRLQSLCPRCIHKLELCKKQRRNEAIYEGKI